MREAIQDGFEPDTFVKVRKISTHTVSKDILQELTGFLKYNYETKVDTKDGVIYIGKKV